MEYVCTIDILTWLENYMMNTCAKTPYFLNLYIAYASLYIYPCKVNIKGHMKIKILKYNFNSYYEKIVYFNFSRWTYYILCCCR